MDQQTITIIIEIATFLVFLYILGRLFARPVSRLFGGRTDRIATALHAAEENQRRAAQAQQEAQRQLDQARVEAQSIAAAAAKAAEAQRQTLIAQAEQDSAALVQRARDAIQRERQAAVDELRREAGRLAVLAAGKVVTGALDDKANRDLADRAIADVGGTR